MANEPSLRHLPVVDVETAPFWNACREHRLLLRTCNRCGTVSFYPRPFCPSCWSDDVSWVDASGRATLYTWSVVHRNDLPPFDQRVPYVAAIVELAEGPLMMTNIVDVEHDDLRIGMPLEVVFRAESDDIVIPLFRPATDASLPDG